MTVKIPLSRGKYALIDSEDFEKIRPHRWYARHGGKGNFYAVSRKYVNGKPVDTYMHRLVTGAGAGQVTDHRNHDTLDNRRSNLRLATRVQNQGNRRKSPGKLSLYKGVTWHKQAKRWWAYITRNSGLKSLGLYDDEREAARAYDRAAREYFGEFALLNFPGETAALPEAA